MEANKNPKAIIGAIVILSVACFAFINYPRPTHIVPTVATSQSIEIPTTDAEKPRHVQLPDVQLVKTFFALIQRFLPAS
jgi:hypothetical protein